MTARLTCLVVSSFRRRRSGDLSQSSSEASRASKFPVDMAAPAASALRPPAGCFLLPSCTQASACGQRRPPLLKVLFQQPWKIGFLTSCVKKCAAASDHGRQELRASDYQFDNDEPLWLAVVRNLVADLRGLVAFLAEQPRQLKFLEWPGFQNTLKTASLTLILVAVFIVALSTVDAALCYIMACLLRKSA